LIAFPLQTIEFTKYMRQASAVQIIYMDVPTFRASRCQGRGMSERMNPTPENTVKTVLEAVIGSLCFLEPQGEVWWTGRRVEEKTKNGPR